MRLRSILPARGVLLIYLAVITAALVMFTPQKLSTNLLGIFPKNSATNHLRDASSLGTLNRLLIISKGFDEASRKRMAEIAGSLEDVEGISTIYYRSDRVDNVLTDALQKNYYGRSLLNATVPDEKMIREKIEALYRSASSSFLFTPINTSDPLGLFSDPMGGGDAPERGGYMILGDKGYLLSATLNIPVADAKQSRELMESVESVISVYGDAVVAMAPHFFTAQNSAKIKGEVNLIVTATIVLLLLFYAVALKNFTVLIMTSAVLAGSLFTGLSVVTALFEEVSVFTLAFGAGIVMMAVDYFFHYYFHGYYGRAYPRRKVLFAFLTTATGFAVLSFAAFPLIEQLSVFAIVALAFAYFQFTYLFANFEMQPKPQRLPMPKPSRGFVQPLYVTLTASTLLAVALFKLTFDGELRRLDYQNHELQQLHAYFKQEGEQRVPVMLYGDTLDAVIAKAEQVKKQHNGLKSSADIYRSADAYAAYKQALEKIDFVQLRQSIEAIAIETGFREGTFSDAYGFVPKIAYRSPEIEVLNALGFETIKSGTGRWLSIAYLEESDAIGFVNEEEAILLESGKLLKESVEGVGSQLLTIALATLAAISVFLVAVLRRDALRAINYILMPLSVILLLLAFTTPLSLMHLFALIIVMVAGIDYGIYMSRPEEQTDEAIYYAMLTTFAGFGIFVFSNIGALHHIGTVIAMGIVAIFILQRIQLRRG
jgi:predicted exporter